MFFLCFVASLASPPIRLLAIPFVPWCNDRSTYTACLFLPYAQRIQMMFAVILEERVKQQKHIGEWKYVV